MPVIALSVTEAELYAAFMCVQDQKGTQQGLVYSMLIEATTK